MSSADLYAFDAALAATAPLLCGVDEAGRGPLCGPVAVGAVILGPACAPDGLDDSKKLSEKRRESLYERIVAEAVCWNVVLVSPQAIDRMNIREATLLGMQKAVDALKTVPDLVLVDGNALPLLRVPAQAVVGGDARSAAIAAASILAKVTRDRYMYQLDAAYPCYKLAKHKGYATEEHYQMLDIYGPADFYRRSFLKKWEEAAPRRRGEAGETLAAAHYQNRGYTLAARNYRTRRGEIDLVLQKEGLLVFAEVKTRTGGTAAPREAVDGKKQHKLVAAAQAYLAFEVKHEPFVRFDVVEVILRNGKEPLVTCLEGAFEL